MLCRYDDHHLFAEKLDVIQSRVGLTFWACEDRDIDFASNELLFKFSCGIPMALVVSVSKAGHNLDQQLGRDGAHHSQAYRGRLFFALRSPVIFFTAEVCSQTLCR